MVMDQGDFNLMDKNLKFTIFWELAYLSKSTESQLNPSLDLITNSRF